MPEVERVRIGEEEQQHLTELAGSRLDY